MRAEIGGERATTVTQLELNGKQLPEVSALGFVINLPRIALGSKS